MDTKDLTPQFVSSKRVIVLIDLAGNTKAFQSQGDEQMAILLQEYYVDCEKMFAERGGMVIKFMGDACLAVFPVDTAEGAVNAVIELQRRIKDLGLHYHLNIALGANLHAGSVIEGKFGAGSNRKTDILGRSVNQTFLLGRGPGIRISEPVYRGLPSAARSPWQKYKPPAVYHLENATEVYDGIGKSPASNLDRW